MKCSNALRAGHKDRYATLTDIKSANSRTKRSNSTTKIIRNYQSDQNEIQIGQTKNNNNNN